MQSIETLAVTKKLKLSDEERVYLDDKMKLIEDSFAVLDQIKTENIGPLISVLDPKNVLREDVSIKTISRQALLENAPEQYDGYFQVPKALD